MKGYRALLVLVGILGLVLASGAAGAVWAGDETGGVLEQQAEVLRLRAEAPAEPVPVRVQDEAARSRVLFWMTAPDNAACVRGISDVTGDGKDEVVVGIDESGVDNVFMLDGASSGPATVVWSLQTNDGVSGGSPYGDQSIVPISDADGDGIPGILLGTAWGGRTAYQIDAKDGKIVWKYDTYSDPDAGWVYSLAEMSDTTGDGIPEVAFGAGSYNDTLYYVDGASGPGQATVIWKYAAADAVASVRNIGDVNGDGADDVVAAIQDNGQQLVCLSGGAAGPAGELVWQYPAWDNTYAVEVLPDITGDGINEALAVVWTMDGSAIRCINGAYGILVWSSTQIPEYGMMASILEDVTGDGHPEIIVSSFENAVSVLSGADGSLVWKTSVGTLNGGDVWTARAIDDLNGDGHQDVIAGSFDLNVYAMDGIDGEILWSYETKNRIFSVAPVGDLDGDGVPEVAAGTQDTTDQTVVIVLSGSNREPLIFVDGFESGDTTIWSSTTP